MAVIGSPGRFCKAACSGWSYDNEQWLRQFLKYEDEDENEEVILVEERDPECRHVQHRYGKQIGGERGHWFASLSISHTTAVWGCF